MYSLLLVIIYIAFISLGLPDSLLGSAWPVMYHELEVPMSYAGIVTMIIAGGTIVSSLMSNRVTRRFGTYLVTSVSVLLTAIGLFGFSISKSFILLCIFAIPYGLGAGAVDAALNNYVALYYNSRHMNHLHCFWGVGATISPYIMGLCLSRGLGYSNGYLSVAIIQVVITALLFASYPLWRKNGQTMKNKAANGRHITIKEAVGIKGVRYILIGFFSYIALEATAGLWASSYLVEFRNVDADTAATFASMFFLGITVGRFISGFVSDRVGDRLMIRSGIIICMFGILLIALPFSSVFSLSGLVIAGLGCAPIYPAVIHSTPSNFGKENSQAIIGIQMACSYMGSTLMPPLFGVIADYVNIGFYPYFLAFFAVLMLVMTEKLNKAVSNLV
ncbi:MAG: MFS transporter [Clostridiaceae bacterium]|nr:MFS transporter [Clostridiaceae bacterium]